MRTSANDQPEKLERESWRIIDSIPGPIALLTNTLRDPELMRREGRRLERWIDSLG